MITRREIITGGIAAIGFSFVAQSYPIRSMIAEKNDVFNSYEEEQPFYIKDGLVAMWDGELSNGELVDVISGIDGTIPSTVSYSPTEKCFLFSENAEVQYNLSSIAQDAYMSANCTYEICCSILPYTYVGSRTIFATPDYTISWYTPRSKTSTQNYVFYNYYGRASRVVRCLDSDGDFTGTLTLTCNTSNMIGVEYANAVRDGFNIKFSTIPSTQQQYFFSRLMPNAKIYSLRIYNRPLSNQEVSYNYSIDRERFNLP